MKRLFIIFSAIVALAGCTVELIEPEVITPDAEQSQVIKVNLSISRADDFAGTKASVKTNWVNGDVVFIFFKGVDAPKYLEMSYDGTDWTAMAKNTLSAADLSGAVDKKMTAVYLPYGSTATVSEVDGCFVFNGLNYSGIFLTDELVSYTYDSELTGTLSLTAPVPVAIGDKYIHFDITGYTLGHDYAINQDHVKPITFTSVSADGVVSYVEGEAGDSITGYYDSHLSIISFSGLLDARAVGSPTDYQFSVDDKTSSIIYTRDAGTKTLNASKYIGLGDISDSGIWTSTEYVDLGLSVKWATCNLGASIPEDSGDLYAWGETSPKASYTWATYSFGTSDEGPFTKYVNDSSYGVVDNKLVLDYEDDAAYVNLHGNWRMPLSSEMDELFNQCIWTKTADGYLGVSKINGNSILLKGFMWSSSSIAYKDYTRYAISMAYHPSEDYPYLYYGGYRCTGLSIRPVYGSIIPVSSISIPSSLSLTMGEMKTITPTILPTNTPFKKVKWLSSNPSIVFVSDNGEMISVSEGVATITAISADGAHSATCSVTVTSSEYPAPTAVDLGLSVKWASFNLGASAPEEYGYYFSFGETEPKADYSWEYYKYAEPGSSFNSQAFTKYNSEDGKTVLDAEDDAAIVNLGGNWRTPTMEEFSELQTQCDWTWTTINGVYGCLAESKINGNSIFIPAAAEKESLYRNNFVGTEGNLMSATLNGHTRRYYFWLSPSFGYQGVASGNSRSYGQSVRPVYVD